MSETDVTAGQVRQEHLEQTAEHAHWLYFGGVLAGSFILMLIVMAVLDASA